MIRVISSPSSSTTGPSTLIFAIPQSLLCRDSPQNISWPVGRYPFSRDRLDPLAADPVAAPTVPASCTRSPAPSWTARGNITELQQFTSTESGRFFMRVQVESGFDRSQFERALRRRSPKRSAPTGSSTSSDAAGAPSCSPRKAGHCLNDLLFRQRAGHLPIDDPAVLANHPDLATSPASTGCRSSRTR